MTNELIAEKVMGWKWKNPASGRIGFYCGDKFICFAVDPPNFLTDMNAALMVIEKMRENGYFVDIDNDYIHDQYDVVFFGGDSEVNIDAVNKSLPIAICTAALSALEK